MFLLIHGINQTAEVLQQRLLHAVWGCCCVASAVMCAASSAAAARRLREQQQPAPQQQQRQQQEGFQTLQQEPQSASVLGEEALHFNSETEIGGRSIRIEKQLAEGGYAYVCLARDTKTDEVFALKRLPYADAEGLAFAVRERDVLASLPPHANVVGCHGSLCVGPQGAPRGSGEVLLLLDYCRGGSLLDLLHRRQKPEEGLEEPVIRRVLLHVARALCHLHSQTPPLVHCDLKAENILWAPPSTWEGPQAAPSLSLGALWSRARGQSAACRPGKAADGAEGLEGIFMLCDFGSCMRGIVDPSKGGREAKLAIGEAIEKHTTLAYRHVLAPEMVDLYLDLPVGPPADIWMLGCVLFVLCFYRHPFEEASALAISNGAFTIPSNHNRPTAQQLVAALAAPEGVAELLQRQQKQQEKQQRQGQPKQQRQQQQQHQRKRADAAASSKQKAERGERSKRQHPTEEDFAFDPCAAAPPSAQQQQLLQEQEQQQQHAADPWGHAHLLQNKDPWRHLPERQPQQQQPKEEQQPQQANSCVWVLEGSWGPSLPKEEACKKRVSSSDKRSTCNSDGGAAGSGVRTAGKPSPMRHSFPEGFCLLDGFVSPHSRHPPAAAAAGHGASRASPAGASRGRSSPSLNGRWGAFGRQGSQQQDLLFGQLLPMREQMLQQQEQQQQQQKEQEHLVTQLAAWALPSPSGRIPSPLKQDQGNCSSTAAATAGGVQEGAVGFSLKTSFDRGLLRLWERMPQPAAPPEVQLESSGSNGF
ncbi:hypothetical protein Efla_006377 [Eimeria flavescens]